MFESFKAKFLAYKRPIIFCAIASIGSLVFGYDNTYYTGILGMKPFIDQYGDHLNEYGQKALSPSFTSLTTSSIYIGDAFGALLSAPANDRFGRKAVFYLACFCVLGGGVAQVADTHFEGVIVLGRIFIGLGVGMFTVTSLLYIGEVAPAAVRGPALMMYQFLQSCSQLVASGMAQGTQSIKSAASYKILMGGLILLPLLMLIGLPFIPETPTWLVSKKRKADAEKSLGRIHKDNPEYDVSIQMTSLEEAVRCDLEDKEGTSWIQLITNPIERRKLIISCGALFTSQINGIIFFYVYGVIFAQAIGVKEPFIISLITNTLQIFAVGASVLLGNKVRRRINLIVTSSIMILAFLVIGGIGTRKHITTAGQYVIVIFSYFVIVAYNFGPGPLAYTIAREMAVGANQNKILSVSIIVFYFTIWLTSFTAPYLYYSANLGPMLGFIYAGTTCLSIAYTWFYIGETAGRTNLEITLFFREKIPVRQWRTHVFDVPEVILERRESKLTPATKEVYVEVA